MTNVSTNPTFALFLDIMGVQQRLVDADDVAMADCREISERFHSYLDEVVRREIDAIAAGGVWHAPRFVAEFSDSAYPLRGGIGFGTFSHETSGSSVRGQEQVWSTSSFFGSAIVTAYRAERSHVVGLSLGLNNLQGWLPPTLTDLKRLRSLDVMMNLLTGTLPDGILEKWDRNEFELSVSATDSRTWLQAQELNCLHQE